MKDKFGVELVKSQGGKFTFAAKVNLLFKHQIYLSGLRFTFSIKKITPSDVDAHVKLGRSKRA